MNRQLALSKSSWNKTVELLKQKTSDFNQDIEVTEKRQNTWNNIMIGMTSFLGKIFGKKPKEKVLK